MSRKVFSLICLLVLAATPAVLTGQEKAKTIEYLLTAGEFDPYMFRFSPVDPTQTENFASPTLLTVTVPASRNSGVVFFDIFGHIWYYWSKFQDRYLFVILEFFVRSPLIPPGIEVWSAGTLMENSDTNLSGIQSGRNRGRHSMKYMMKRDTYLTSWTNGFDVRYEGTNTKIPESQAVALINDLMDSGFELEFRLKGSLLGIDWIDGVQIKVEATRLAK